MILVHDCASYGTYFVLVFSSHLKVLIWQAAELLRHPHLQPYVLKVHLKINCPRRNSLSVHWPESNYIRKTRFSEPDDVPIPYRQKRHSYSNDRNLNPSISGAEQDSLCSTKGIHSNPGYLSRRLSALSIDSSDEGTVICKPIASKTSNVAKTAKLTPPKTAATHRRKTDAVKNREYVRTQNFLSLSLSHSHRRVYT